MVYPFAADYAICGSDDTDLRTLLPNVITLLVQPKATTYYQSITVS